MNKLDFKFTSSIAKTCRYMIYLVLVFCFSSCGNVNQEKDTPEMKSLSAKEILGNPKYQAISYGGYRTKTRDDQPTINQLKEDLLLLNAIDVKILRTYNTHFKQAENLLNAIAELKKEDPNFEMYVMLGAWINCKDAFTAEPMHNQEDVEANTTEIARAVALAKQYPDIVKVIAVGNEAMVKWAASYYVQPAIILKWVNHLQGLKDSGELSKDLWITSSDNFASWGGGDSLYHVKDLENLIKAVDYISLHTYPMHDSHYNPEYWGIETQEAELPKEEKIEKAMERALEYAQTQYDATAQYVKSLNIEKPIHIGETGWASFSNGHYGDDGSKATDEYKEGRYYELMRGWTNKNGISCFYFEAFDEIWKDAANPGGSENHFGLFTIDGKAKYALWDKVDKGVFKGLTRNGNKIEKTFEGKLTELMKTVKLPPQKNKK